MTDRYILPSPQDKLGLILHLLLYGGFEAWPVTDFLGVVDHRVNLGVRTAWAPDLGAAVTGSNPCGDAGGECLAAGMRGVIGPHQAETR